MNIFVAGHRGMVGSAIVRSLAHSSRSNDQINIITKNRAELDLTNQEEVKSFFNESKIDIVIIAAAKVGGIYANNNYPAEFIFQNLSIQTNLIHQSYVSGIKKLIFLGSSCIYPREATQPINEKDLLTGTLEPTNEPYAIAKIAGIKMCESYNRQYDCDFRSIMPTNLYGEGDNFHLKNSHVLPALIRKFHEASFNNDREVAVWGSGNVYREFLHVDDMASATLFLMNVNKELYMKHTEPMLSHVNAGSGLEISIKNLATLIGEITNFKGDIIFDSSKPDGTPRKLMDSSTIRDMGWSPSIELRAGIESTYEWFKLNKSLFD